MDENRAERTGKKRTVDERLGDVGTERFTRGKRRPQDRPGEALSAVADEHRRAVLDVLDSAPAVRITGHAGR